MLFRSAVENNYVWASSLKFDNFMGNPYVADIFDYSHFTGGIYKLFYPKYDVSQVTTITNGTGSQMVETTTYNSMDYTQSVSFGNYTHQADFRKILSETRTVADNSITTAYTYPFSNGTDWVTQQLYSQHFFLQPISITMSSQDQVISKTATKYSIFNNLILPFCEIEYKGSEPDTLVTYQSYTNTGTVSQFRERGRGVTTLAWGWNDNHLLSKTTGTHVTQYTYDPLSLSLTGITQPNGNYESYSYDGLGRLTEVRDRNGRLKKSITYNYNNK